VQGQQMLVGRNHVLARVQCAGDEIKGRVYAAHELHHHVHIRAQKVGGIGGEAHLGAGLHGPLLGQVAHQHGGYGHRPPRAGEDDLAVLVQNLGES